MRASRKGDGLPPFPSRRPAAAEADDFHRLRVSQSASVLGMEDVVVANDPVTGQGANNAHCADIYFRSILDHGDRPFDEEWMRHTFEKYWDYVRHPTAYTNIMLGPPPDHVQRVSPPP